MPPLESPESHNGRACKLQGRLPALQPSPNTSKVIKFKRKKKWPQSHPSCLLSSGTWFETFLYNFHLWSTAFGEQVQGIELLNGKPEGQGEKDPRVYFLNTRSSIGPPPIICSVFICAEQPCLAPGHLPQLAPWPGGVFIAQHCPGGLSGAPRDKRDPGRLN